MIWSKGTRIIPNFIGLTFWDGVGKGKKRTFGLHAYVVTINTVHVTMKKEKKTDG